MKDESLTQYGEDNTAVPYNIVRTILQYYAYGTPVLYGKYSGTMRRVLQYYAESTPVSCREYGIGTAGKFAADAKKNDRPHLPLLGTVRTVYPSLTEKMYLIGLTACRLFRLRSAHTCPVQALTVPCRFPGSYACRGDGLSCHTG